MTSIPYFQTPDHLQNIEQAAKAIENGAEEAKTIQGDIRNNTDSLNERLSKATELIDDDAFLL